MLILIENDLPEADFNVRQIEPRSCDPVENDRADLVEIDGDLTVFGCQGSVVPGEDCADGFVGNTKRRRPRRRHGVRLDDLVGESGYQILDCICQRGGQKTQLLR